MVHPAAPSSLFWASTQTIDNWPAFIKSQFGACLPVADAVGAPELALTDDTRQTLLHALLTPAIGLPSAQQQTNGHTPKFPASTFAERYLAFTSIPASAAIVVASFWSPVSRSWGEPVLTIVGAPAVAERGAFHNASFYWPGPPGSVLLNPGNLPRPDGDMPVLAATFQHDSRENLHDRNHWYSHDLLAWSFDPNLFRRVIAPATTTLPPSSEGTAPAQAWCHSLECYQAAVQAGCISVCQSDPASWQPDTLHFIILPQALWLPSGFHLPIGGTWNPTIGLQGFIQSLQEMSGYSDDSLGNWLICPYVQEWFTAVASSPGSFVTNWTLHKDISTSVEQAADRAPEVFSFIRATVAYRLHRDGILVKSTKSRRESYLRYEQAALTTTFTSPDVYMGQHHVTMAPDLWYFRPPKTTQWIRDLKLASYVASPAVPMLADRIIYKVPTGRGSEVPSIPWLTEAAAREQVAAAEEDDASDNSVTQAWLAAQATRHSKRRAVASMPGDSINDQGEDDIEFLGHFPPGAAATSHSASKQPWQKHKNTPPSFPMEGTHYPPSYHLNPSDLFGGASLSHQRVQASHFSWTPPRSVPPQSFQSLQKLDDPLHPTLAPSKELNFCDLSTTSSDPRVRGHALLSLLLTYQDTDIRLVTKTGRPVAKAACLLPMRLGDAWRANFHQPEKVDHALYWLEDTYRMEELNAFNLSTPIISQAFFQRKVIEPLKDGRWRLMSLENLRETDLTNSFTALHFLLTLPGFNYPPKLPLGGLSITQTLDLFKNIKWLLSTATADKAAISSGLPNPFRNTILATHLQALEQMLTSARSLNLAWQSNQQRISIQVLSFLAQLFSVFGRWLAHGPLIHLVSDGQRSDIPVVDSAVFTNVGRECSLLEALDHWLHEARLVLCSHHAMHPLLQSDMLLPQYLWESHPKPSQLNEKKKPGAQLQTPDINMQTPPGETPNNDQNNLKPTYTCASIPLFGWTSTCSDAIKAKPVYSILKDLREKDPSIQAPVFLDTAERDPSKRGKQLCFAYVVAGSRGCSGYMKAKYRRQKCNRAHICLKATDWLAVPPESYKNIVEWLNKPAVKAIFAPSAEFAASTLYTSNL